jgi:hypothetical protein
VQRILTNILISTRPQHINVSFLSDERHNELGLGHYIANKLHFHMHFALFHSPYVSFDRSSTGSSSTSGSYGGGGGGYYSNMNTSGGGGSGNENFGFGSGEAPRVRLDSMSLRDSVGSPSPTIKPSTSSTGNISNGVMMMTRSSFFKRSASSGGGSTEISDESMMFSTPPVPPPPPPPPPPLLRTYTPLSPFSPRSPPSPFSSSSSHNNGQFTSPLRSLLIQSLPINQIPQFWLENRDLCVGINLAIALGTSLLPLVNHLEEAAEYLNAARVAFLATLLAGSNNDNKFDINSVDLLFRAADLIQKCNQKLSTNTLAATTSNTNTNTTKSADSNDNEDHFREEVPNDMEESIWFDFEWQVVQACSLRRWGTAEMGKAIQRVNTLIETFMKSNTTKPLKVDTGRRAIHNANIASSSSKIQEKFPRNPLNYLHPLAKYEVVAMKAALSLNEAIKCMNVKHDASVKPLPGDMQFEQALTIIVEKFPLLFQAAQLAPHESLNNLMKNVYCARLLGLFGATVSHLKLWNSTLKDLPQLECDLVKGIEFYKPITCHVVFKHVGELLL